MRSMLISVFVTCLTALATAQDKLPVLLVSGANNHDWKFTSVSLAEILTASDKFELTVTEDPGTTLADPELGTKYVALVLDYNGPRWGQAAEKNFLEVVQAGMGITIVHAADNAFPGWVEYEKLTALLWRDGTGHGRFHPFDVKVIDRDHPITRGLPDLRAHPDELYHRLVHMHDAEYRVLATAFSDPETGGTGDDEPMIIVGNYGRGRIFHTPLGHVWTGNEPSRASHADEQFHNVIVRGTEWAATGKVTDGKRHPNQLSQVDQRAGWSLLFDGDTTRGWTGFGQNAFPTEGWDVIDGCLRHTQGGGDIATGASYENFELEFEWKLAPGANSGVKYRLLPDQGAALGPEYQLLDAARHADGAHALQTVGALYAVVEASAPRPALLGSFNHSRIIARGTLIEHWLNGERLFATEVGSDDWKQRIAASKFAKVIGFGSGSGPIVLQDHGDEVWYRSIRIRNFDGLPGRRVELFNGRNTDGWRVLGDASYVANDGTILGTVTGGAQSFLITERSYADFMLEVDVKTEDKGNSGIQVRSHVRENGQLYGYQIEIDPSERAWTGGLYDEGRRAWLDDLADNPAGRAAFKYGQWNRFRIECIGTSIRAWVNGVLTADFVDDADSEGVIGLQVHSGNNTRVRWRGLTLWELGE